MIFEEMMRDERNGGKIEKAQDVIFDLLEDVGSVTKELHERIETITDEEILRILYKKAARVDSVEQFQKETEEIFAKYASRK